ncbi:MAG TPA: hypothetical protein VGF06_03860 [Terriglobales bacterium]
MKHGFDPYSRNYQSLSVADLLDARDAHHVQLLHLENVFATAIGRFRIRFKDPDHIQPSREDRKRHDKNAEARTMYNTIVRPWSWPCVLVFVKRWFKPEELRDHMDELVPPFLYLPDGRVVPTCVVEAQLYEGPAEAVVGVEAQSPVFGSGQPIITRVQGEEHVGTVACMVSDGEKYYALTNQHVAGAKGTEVFAYVEGELVRIGVSAGIEQKRRPFDQIYPGFAGRFTLSNLDLGLVELDSVAPWTSNMHQGLTKGKLKTQKLGTLIEFRTDTANLDWIGCRVIGFGAASQKMSGQIKALFYRYRSVGGIDYVSDFLVGDPDASLGEKPVQPAADEPGLGTRPGDSGALWCVDPSQFQKSGDEELLPRPFAVQWGGQKLSGAGGPRFTRYALASSLAVGCRELDVEIVTDWNTEHTQYWGAVGHYKIAEMAIGRLSGDLHDFMSRHLKLLTYENILEEPDTKDPDKDFIPLADVPDLVWKKPRKSAGDHADDNGSSKVKRYEFGRRGPENPNHYADIDLQNPGHTPKTIAECGTKAADWEQFYKVAPVPKNGLAAARKQALKEGKPAPSPTGIEFQHQGLLPFRIWQIFEAMQKSAKAGSADEFLCAAGIIAHYVGDSCQPLHGSRHADGLEGAATGVHSSYEDVMVDFAAKDIADGLSAHHYPKLLKIESGEDAARRTLEVMQKAAEKLAPATICREFDKFKAAHHFTGTGKLKSSGPVLAKKFTGKTVDCMALGIHLLASLWESAFRSADSGAAFAVTVSDHQLMKIYKKQDFLPSYYLHSWIEKVGGH